MTHLRKDDLMTETYHRIRNQVWLKAAPALILCVFFLQFGHIGNAASDKKGSLYLVSVGVGDADLITVRAINTIKKSDVIVCNKETKQELAEYVEGKEFLDISLAGWRNYGKDCSETEDKEKREACEKEIKSREELIKGIRSAIGAGKNVSVLGSGDLLLYGGPYHWYLKEFKDIQTQIIPGVSCFNAANAALRKDVASGKETHAAVLTTMRELEKLSAHHPTMVIFTMHTKFEELVGKLKTLYPPQTPIAVVFYAGYKEKERVLKGKLDTILQQAHGEKFPFEHLVYVGDFLE